MPDTPVEIVLSVPVMLVRVVCICASAAASVPPAPVTVVVTVVVVVVVPPPPPEPALVAPNEPPASTPILEQVIRAKEQAETEAILAALNSTRWNRKQAAFLLKIDYKALLYKMKKLGLDDINVATVSLDGPLKSLSASGS